MVNKSNITLHQTGVSILSLFDGMSCGAIAILNAGLKFKSYDAYEIDKYAIKTSQHNFPFIKQHGDVFTANFSEYENVDYLIGGSPCTYWSIAKRKDREVEASGIGWKLFSQYVRALNEAKPKFFIYENNKSMSRQIRESISETFGFDAICINSALVSAQNRQRLYWVGKRNSNGTYSKVQVEQPKDKGIFLKDILEWGQAVCAASRGRYKESSKRTEQHLEVRGRKTNALTKVQKDNLLIIPLNMTSGSKSQCLRSTYYKDGIRNMVGNLVDKRTCVAMSVQVGSMPRPNGELSKSQGFRIYSPEGKGVSLKGNAGGAGGKTGLYALPIGYTDGKPTKAVCTTDNKEYTVYEVSNGTIEIKNKRYPIKLENGFYIIRKLTVKECMRLQTVPEWYDFGVVSNSQAYKMLGNGWTCDIITHLIQATTNNKE